MVQDTFLIDQSADEYSQKQSEKSEKLSKALRLQLSFNATT